MFSEMDQKAIESAIDLGIQGWLKKQQSSRYNIWKVAQFNAALEAARFYQDHMLTATFFKRPQHLRRHCVEHAVPGGLFLEFGVATGRSINRLASQFPHHRFYGFDSFEGLPEAWRSDYKQGHFAQSAPHVSDNVELIIGLFSETLPQFTKDHPDHVSFIHVDCDLYSSTRTIFDEIGDKVVAGTMIVFDEYFNYPGWRHHEHKAFAEFAAQRKIQFEYIGLVPSDKQVAVRVTSVGDKS